MPTDTALDPRLHVIEFARSEDQLVAGLVHGAFEECSLDVPVSFVPARSEWHVVLVDTGAMRAAARR